MGRSRAMELHAAQQRAKQARALERIAAQQAGVAPPPVSKLDKWVLGVKDPKGVAAPPPPPAPAAPPGLEAQVWALTQTVTAQREHIDALQAQVAWAIARIQELQQPKP